LLHSPKYALENAPALQQDWPRIPLPAHKQALKQSAQLGRQLRDLLDPRAPVSGVTSGPIQDEFKSLGVLTAVTGTELDPQRGDLAVVAGWGHSGKDGVTMPAKGTVKERPDGALDIYLNDKAYWANVPRTVWDYRLGGYQVIKKWLSYREKELLGRDLEPA